MIEYCKENKRLEILPYFQASNLACHSFIDAGRRHKTPKPETKNFITYGIAGNTMWFGWVRKLPVL